MKGTVGEPFKKWGVSVVSIFVGGVIILLLLLMFNISTEKAVERSIQHSMDEMNNTAVVSFNNDFKNFTHLLELEAKYFGLLKSPSDKEIMEALIEFAGEGSFKNTAILTLDGMIYSSYRGAVPQKEGEIAMDLSKTETIVTQPRTFIDGNLVVDISTPVYIDGKLIGQLVVSLAGDDFGKMFYQNILQGDAALCLIAGDGTVITRISKRTSPVTTSSNIFGFYNSEKVSFIEGSVEAIQSDLAAGKSTWAKYEYMGEKVGALYEPFGINDWYMCIAATDSTLNAQSAKLKINALFLTLGILGVVATISVIVVLQRVKEQRRIDALKNTYNVAIRKTNDLFYEADIDSGFFVDHSERSDMAPWTETPKDYSSALKQIADICAPECKQQFLDTFLPQNIRIKVKEGISSINFEYKIIPDEYTVRWLSATFVPVVDGQDNSTKLICMENDITDMKLKQESLRMSATMDGLTGLYNKTTTEQRIEAFLRSDGAGGRHALALIDIDFFKSVNDQLGHAKGDELLAEFGQALKKIFRKNDIVGRVGGDEFMVLLKDYGDSRMVNDKMEKIVRTMRKEHFQPETGKRVKTSVSIGVALYERDGSCFAELYKSADEALYVSKENGKDRYTFCC